MKSLTTLAIIITCLPLFAKEVSISIEGKSLHGELNIAETSTKQAVFILSGSGPTDRNGNTVGAQGKNNSLKYLSDVLNKQGITTLRVDKRGVGASSSATVQESDLRFSTYVSDAEHWIKFLEEQGYSKITLIGHSEGALVATLAATSKSVSGLISIAGAGRPAGDILREQLISNLPKELYAEVDKVISGLSNGDEVKDSPPSLNSLFRPSVQPYLISWFQIDPAKSISSLEMHILIIQGSTDIQVSEKDALLLHKSAKGSKLIMIEGMNHVLKEVRGDMNAQLPSYFNPDLALHKDLEKNVIDFLKTLDKEKN